jgi:hypothetical protein
MEQWKNKNEGPEGMDIHTPTGEEIARRHAGAGQREITISVESEKQ